MGAAAAVGEDIFQSAHPSGQRNALSRAHTAGCLAAHPIWQPKIQFSSRLSSGSGGAGTVPEYILQSAHPSGQRNALSRAHTASLARTHGTHERNEADFPVGVGYALTPPNLR